MMRSILLAASATVGDGMNHVLKEVREASQQTASYSDATLQLLPRLVELITRFAGN